MRLGIPAAKAAPIVFQNKWSRIPITTAPTRIAAMLKVFANMVAMRMSHTPKHKNDVSPASSWMYSPPSTSSCCSWALIFDVLICIISFESSVTSVFRR